MDFARRDYVPADTEGSRAIVIVTYVFAVLTIILVALRFVARRIQKLSFAIDDWLVLAALPLLLCHDAVVIVSVYLGGIGHAQVTLSPANVVAQYQTLTALQFTFSWSLGLIKASTLFLLMRLFVTPKFKLVARLILVYVVCWVVVCMLVGFALCRPFHKNWDPTLSGVCGDRVPAYIATASGDVLGSCMILVLPMAKIWRLHTNTHTKIALSIIFAIGVLDVIVGMLRIIYLVQIINDPAVHTSAIVDAWIWSTLEPSLAVFVTCLPTFKPLLKLFHKCRVSSNSSESSRWKFSGKLSSDDGLARAHPHDDGQDSSVGLQPIGKIENRAWVSTKDSQQDIEDDRSSLVDYSGRPPLITWGSSAKSVRSPSQNGIHVERQFTITRYESDDESGRISRIIHTKY